MWGEVVLLALLLLLLRYWMLRPKGLPPGSFTIPFLGSLPVITHEHVKKNRKIYGDIFKSEVGSLISVFLCNYDLIKEALSKPELSNRPDFELVHLLTDGVPAGVVMVNGQHWQNARRFLLRNLRDLGMGKTYLEGAIQTEAQSLVEDFKQHAGTPSPFPKSINVAVLNVVWQLVANKRYDLHDDNIHGFVKIMKEVETNVSLIFLIIFPGLCKILPRFLKRRFFQEDQMRRLKEEGMKLVKEIISSHRTSLDPDNPRDVVDEYLLAMDAKADIATYFSELDLCKVLFDLFGAGFDTTSNLLRWMILYMIKYPEVQRRVQQQIDDVVSRDTLPSYQHKPQLPLLEAMLHELMRASSLLPLGLHRATQRDIYLGGYFIPKGSMVIGCAVCCHEDSQYWDHPEEFRLERFLDAEGKFVSQKEGFLPFGMGRRSCLGESLARMEMYILTAALLQNFSFSMPEGCQVDMESNTKQPIFKQPKEQNILITLRS